MAGHIYPNITSLVGETRMLDVSSLLQPGSSSRLLVKMEGDNPAGSIKDRPAMNMVLQAQKRGEIKSGDSLIEATSGNTGIALAMVCAGLGYKLTLIMPEDMSEERRISMLVYGAELILVTKEQGMEYARDLALEMQAQGKGRVLDQFSNDDNYRVHEFTTGPEIWRDTATTITHFVSSMGTTGTITGVSRFLKEKNRAIQIIGVQPSENSQIPGIRKWSLEYQPKIFAHSIVDNIIEVSQDDAEQRAIQLSRELGVFLGMSSGGALHVAKQIAEENDNATVVYIGCDRGDRYISTGIYSKYNH